LQLHLRLPGVAALELYLRDAVLRARVVGERKPLRAGGFPARGVAALATRLERRVEQRLPSRRVVVDAEAVVGGAADGVEERVQRRELPLGPLPFDLVFRVFDRILDADRRLAGRCLQATGRRHDVAHEIAIAVLVFVATESLPEDSERVSVLHAVGPDHDESSGAVEATEFV
jgi:hypothetical protein